MARLGCGLVSAAAGPGPVVAAVRGAAVRGARVGSAWAGDRLAGGVPFQPVHLAGASGVKLRVAAVAHRLCLIGCVSSQNLLLPGAPPARAGPRSLALECSWPRRVHA